MRKRILALLLALVIAVGLLPTAAWAAETPAAVTDAAGLKAALAAGGEITLGGDFTVSETLTIDKAVTLDLAGHTLTAASDLFCLLQVEEGGEFIIRDSGAEGGIQAAEPASDEDMPHERSPLTLVYMKAGEFWLKGGTLSTAADGIAVQVAYDATGASFLMTGGAIIGNRTGIYLRGSDNVVVVTGGEVESLEGNALYMDDASYAYIGGDVETDGNLNNSGGTLTVTGGVHHSTLYSGTSLKIDTPTTKIYGGTFYGVSQDTYGTMELYGGRFRYSVDYSFKTRQTNKTLKDYIAEGAKCVKPDEEEDSTYLNYIDSNQVMSSFRIIKPAGCAPQLVGIFGGSHGTVTAGGTALDSANRLITDGSEVTAAAGAGYASQVDTSKDGVILVTFLPGEPSHTSAHTHAVSVDCETDSGDQVTFRALTSQDGALCIDGSPLILDTDTYILPAGNYYLAGDIATDKQIKASGAVNLCFNGGTLTSTYVKNSSFSADTTALCVEDGGVFNACDCQRAGGLSAGQNSTSLLYGMGSAAINLYGGVWNQTGNYPCVSVGQSSTTVTVDGATLTSTGNGINLNAGRLVVKSGSITSTAGNLAGVNVFGASVEVTGGAITGGCGIKLGHGSTLALSGSPTITGNSSGDISVSSSTPDRAVTAAEDISEGSRYTVYLENAFSFPDGTPKALTAAAGKDQSGHFSLVPGQASQYSLVLRGTVGADGKHTVELYRNHKWASGWTKDGEHHWHECQNTNNSCTITDYSACGETGAAYAAHTKTWVKTDAAQHWQTCTDCGWAGDKAAHAYDNDQDDTCDTCGYQRTVTPPDPGHTHVWATAWTNNTTHHWHECEGEGTCDVTAAADKNGYAAHSGGTASCTAKAVCVTCGQSHGDLAAHDFTGNYLSDATGHWHKCKNCDATDTKADHVYDDDQDAECNTCGYTRAVTPPDPGHTHTWATTWEKNATHHWHECTADGCDVTANADKNGYAAHVWDEGEVTTQPTVDAEGVKTYTCTVCAATKTEPVPIPTFDVSGTVTDSEDTAVEGAAVKLMRGSTQVASTTTDASGNYSFTNVTPGSYNVVAEQTQDGNTKTMTILVTITNANLSNQNLKMPSDSVNSVLEVKGDDTPAVVVGGLEKEAEANKEENSTVTVTMTVEGKEENTAANAAEIRAVAGDEKKLEYLEIKVEKKVEADGSTTTDTISTTSNLLTIVIPFDFTGKIQSSVTVYRYHDSSVETLTTTASGDGERIVLGADSITLYVKNFSTYAIGYTESAEVNYAVTFDSQGGSAVAAQTVAQNGKVTRPANPTKSGYSFGGWYKEAACATAWNFSTDTVTGNITLYAKWTSSGGTPTGGGGGGYYPTTYPIDIPSGIPNGTVSVSPKSASKGTTVTITATPEEGYQIGTVTVTDKDGKEVPVTGKGDGKYTFTMPAGKVNVSASFTKIGGSYAVCPKNDTCPIWRYTDASTTAWYHDGVHYCIENGLMSGYGNNTFGSDGGTSRAMIATILWRLEGGPVVNYILPFDDVAEGAWYTEAVRWAAASGVVSGYGNGKFGPGDPITREQLAAMLYRYEQYKGGGFTGAWMFPLNYTDAELVSSWAYEPMCWTTMNGIINGIGNGQLDPKGKATRAQVATMIMRFCEKN